jgi:hypothetical protein
MIRMLGDVVPFRLLSRPVNAQPETPKATSADDDPLQPYLDAIRAAELELDAARTKFSAAADELKLSRSGRLSESIFVYRSSAEKWEREAERLGYRRATDEICNALERCRGV